MLALTSTIIFSLTVLGGLAFYYFIVRKEIAQLKKDKEELEIAEKESIDEFTERVKEIDKGLSDYIEAVQRKNTVVFDCPCSNNPIPTVIDLSKEENTFVCPECKNEYRVDITMVPVLKGRIIDERNMYNLLSKKFLEGRMASHSDNDNN